MPIIGEVRFLDFQREQGTFTLKSARGKRYDRAFIEKWLAKALDDVLDLMSDGDTLSISIIGDSDEDTHL